MLQCSDLLLNRALGSTCDVAAAQTVQSQGHVGPEYMTLFRLNAVMSIFMSKSFSFLHFSFFNFFSF